MWARRRPRPPLPLFELTRLPEKPAEWKAIAFDVRSAVELIARTPDADLRGHQIALAYHRCALILQHALGASLRPGRSHANWFVFATWATATLSRDIRGVRPPAQLSGSPVLNPRRALAPVAIRGRQENGQEISRALSWAQRLVFISTLLTFAEALDHIDENTLPPDAAENVRARVTEIGPKSKDPKADVPWLDDKRHLSSLVNAFNVYLRIRTASEDADHHRLNARRLLLANMTITAVEQDVVDPAVQLAIEGVPLWAMRRGDDLVARLGDRIAGLPRQITALSLPHRHSEARHLVGQLWARLLTDQILVMALPTETIRLGRDIPPRTPGGPFCSDDLRFDLRTDTTGLDEDEILLIEWIAAFDRSRGDGRGSAARDWRRFDERMNWAINLLRSRQEDPSLYWSPYIAADVELLASNRYPMRNGDPIEREVEAPLGWPEHRRP